MAEEAGLEMVVVCGHNMGDIFRRNAFNLGLHVVQSPEAVADAQDGDELTFDPTSRRLANVTRGKTYDPGAADVQGGRDPQEWRNLRARPPRVRRRHAHAARIEWPPPDLARRMTTTEQILWAHRVDKNADVRPGSTLRCYADLLPASDGTAPFSIHTFQQITGGESIHPRQIAIANDHFVFTGLEADDRQTSIGRAFAALHGIVKPYYATPATASSTSTSRAGDWCCPASSSPAPTRTAARTAPTARSASASDPPRSASGWATGYVYTTVAKQRRVVFAGELQPWVTGKDIVLELLRRWGAKQSQGMSVEFVDRERQLPIAFRNTIANMMAEAEAMNGIFAPDDITYAWYRAKGMNDLPYPRIAPGADAVFEIDETLALPDVVPMIAKPFSPGNAFPAEEVAKERIDVRQSHDRIVHERRLRRSAVRRPRDPRRACAGTRQVSKPFVIFPGSGGVKHAIENPDPRLNGESIANVFRSVGGEIRQSWCGPCFGQGPDSLTRGQRAITSFNRNWTNRMGVGGEGYLASPAVVAELGAAGVHGAAE